MDRGPVLVSLAALAAGAACGRSQGVSDEQLGDLVLDRKGPAPIDVERAAKDPAELGRALTRSHGEVTAALGPHTAKIALANRTLEGGKQIYALDEQTTLELGEGGAFHALYNNSADYGSETIFAGGKLYLRPRYQRWHERGPEAPDEPAALRERAFGGIAATWDLLAPGAELIDRGAIEIAGRAGRKIEVRLSPTPPAPAPEPLSQRKWRETRSVDELSGEVVLDADKGVPLAVKLAGAIGYTQDGRRRTMKLGVDGAISGIGTAVAIAAPPRAEVVATPERIGEVDERDFLLKNIAPPLRTNPDGTEAVTRPQPATSGQPGGRTPDKAPADKPKPKPDPAKSDPAKPDPPKADPARPDAVKAKPDAPKPDKPAPDKPKSESRTPNEQKPAPSGEGAP